MKAFLKNSIAVHKWPLIFLLLTWGTYFIALFSRIIKIKLDGIWAGHLNVWSDWSLHIAMANTYAFKPIGYWFSYNPLYSDGKATYPFFTNLISGMLMRLGIPLELSFIIPSIIFSLALIIGLYILGYLLLKSRTAAVLAVFLFLLSSNFGFINFLKDFFADPSWDMLAYPPEEYSRFDGLEWYSGNVMTGLIVPQRAFLLGMALGVWALSGLIFSLTRRMLEERAKKIILAVSGILAGLLPVVHAHGFMVVAIASFCVCLTNFRQIKTWLWYALPATVLSSLLYFKFIYSGIENPDFMSWFVGYTAKPGFKNWLTMWFWISGIAVPAAIFGWAVWIRNKTSHAFFIAFFIVFIAGNLYLFQPIHWDNSKLFFWSFLGMSYLAGAGIVWLWQSKRKYAGRAAAIALILVLTATGILEATRLQNTRRNGYLMTSSEDIKLGLEIRSKTGPLDKFLTAPQHNHFIMMWGLRPILLGYTAWAWNFGFLYQDRYDAMVQIYLGSYQTENLLKKYNISYVAIGPAERYDLNANEQYFYQRFPVAFSNSNYTIYDTRKALGQ